MARPQISDYVSQSDVDRLSPTEVVRLARFRHGQAFDEWARTTARKAVRPEDLETYRAGVVGNLSLTLAAPESA